MIVVAHPQQIKDKLGIPCICPLTREVDEPMLSAFNAISQDRSGLHSVSASEVVIPGNLLIALLPAMLQSGFRVEKFGHCKTVALTRLRFHQSVTLRQPLQLSFSILKSKTLQHNTFVTSELVLALVADGTAVLSAEQTDCYVTCPAEGC